MSLFLPLKRATVLAPSGPDSDPERKHLFVVLTNPTDVDKETKALLMVPLSSIKQGLPYDASCVLHPGDHPFVKRESFVDYRRARIEDVKKILRGVKDDKLIPQEPIDAAIFARICQGLVRSRLTTPKVLMFYRLAADRIGGRSEP